MAHSNGSKNVNEKKDTPLINHKTRIRACVPNATHGFFPLISTMQHIVLFTLLAQHKNMTFYTAVSYTYSKIDMTVCFITHCN